MQAAFCYDVVSCCHDNLCACLFLPYSFLMMKPPSCWESNELQNLRINHVIIYYTVTVTHALVNNIRILDVFKNNVFKCPELFGFVEVGTLKLLRCVFHPHYYPV